MDKKQILKWVFGICGLFLLLNAFFIANEAYWFVLIPVLGFIMLLYITSLDKILLLIAFLTPLSIELRDRDLGLGISLPVAPLLAGVLLLFIFKIFYDQYYDGKIFRHPVTIAIIFYLTWVLMTSITSQYPVVSFKFLVARLWFIIPFYFLGTQLFKNIKYIKIFCWLYTISLAIVIIYTTYRHSYFGFSEQVGHWIMDPFYNDHTAYGAMIAFFMPVIFGFLFDREYSNVQRFLTFLVFSVLFVGLYLSYCRAAWLGFAASLVIFFIIKLRIKFKWILFSFISLIIFFFLLKSEIIMKLEKNRQDTSGKLMQHIESMSNISTDASNLERINRWTSAFRMFKERPIFGFGPGTYQFCYAPFQYSYEKTIISTNAGTKGNAHSEYIGPLAETGVLGSLSVIIIALLVLYTAIKVYNRATDRKVKLLSLLALMGLMTYYIHGFLNNFLDTDKAAVPFWGFVAIIVALDVYHNKKPETT